MFEGSECIVVLVDLADPVKLKRVSKKLCNLLGWTEEEMLTNPMMDFIHPDDVDETQKVMQNVNKHIAMFSSENRYHTKEGNNYRWFRWVGLPQSSSKSELILGIAHDITKEKNRELEIQKLNKQLRKKNIILQTVDRLGTIYSTPMRDDFSLSESGLYSLQDNHIFKLIAETFLQISKSEITFLKEIFYENQQITMGKAFFGKPVIPEWMCQISAPLDELLKNVLTRKQPFIDNKFLGVYSCLVLPFHSDPYNLLGFIVLINTQGHDYTSEFVSWLGPLIDKTSQVLGNTKLLRWQREIEKKEAQRQEEELAFQRIMRAQAEKENKIKSTFLAHISHEMRMPLASILGLLEVIEVEVLPEEASKNLKIAQQSGWSLLNILNDILDISKIEANQLMLEKIEFELPKLLEKLKKILSLEAKKKILVLSSQLIQEFHLA